MVRIKTRRSRKRKQNSDDSAEENLSTMSDPDYINSEEETQSIPGKKSVIQPTDISAGSSTSRAKPRKKIGRGSNYKVSRMRDTSKKWKKSTWNDPRGSANSNSSEEESENIQCYMVNCCNIARPGSKYCSDTCGLNLAKMRLQTIIPERLKVWDRAPSVAEQRNQKELKKLLDEKQVVMEELHNLRQQRNDLEAFFVEISKIEYDPSESQGVKVKGKEEGSTWCVTCGLDVNFKTYLKHIEKCFSKTEKFTSLDSSAPTFGEIAKEIICDVYNKVTQRYCKKLSITCPEHKRGQKIIPNREICGAPLDHVLDITKICKASRKDCGVHHGWENLRVGQVDVQLMALIRKMELFSLKEHELRNAMINRKGVMNLLLHPTIEHSNDSKIPRCSSSQPSEKVQ